MAHFQFSPIQETMFDSINNLGNWEDRDFLQISAINYSGEEIGGGSGGDNSGEVPPPLWKPRRSPSRPLLRRMSPPSPNSRREAIARGRWELMEMVNNMPESYYELSLKDIVERRPPAAAVDHPRTAAGEAKLAAVRKQESKKLSAMKFDYNKDKGFLLNVGFQFSSSGKSRKRDKRNNSSGGSDGGADKYGRGSGKREGGLSGCWPPYLQWRKVMMRN
ncbi:uncharacterized protein LOC127257363 [Andrographis paniculata]|uniref:uncharacterized protein LOC127257363 n=1 Tax=Andrographis paniculata TaxID=175694 RepID=UPI0021E7AE05|nr:uncharacterized protein LOC127257363 [Andrographis paniculata]